jgi:hypothetical protein
MPKFLDYHASMPQLPPEVAQQLAATVRAGQADEFGVKPLNVYMGTGGSAHCLTEAPSADAVAKSHVAKGFPLDASAVTEVMSLV